MYHVSLYTVTNWIHVLSFVLNSSTNIWIGLSKSSQGLWFWSDYTSLESAHYQNWEYDLDETGGSCATVQGTGSNVESAPCTEEKAFVCQYRAWGRFPFNEPVWHTTPVFFWLVSLSESFFTLQVIQAPFADFQCVKTPLIRLFTRIDMGSRDCQFMYQMTFLTHGSTYRICFLWFHPTN